MNSQLFLLTIVFALLAYLIFGPLQEGVNPEYLPRTVQIIGAGLMGIILIKIITTIYENEEKSKGEKK